GAAATFRAAQHAATTGYYPFAFDLQPFGDDALYRFLVFELPRGMALPPGPGEDPRSALALAAVAPEPIEFEFVGELYAKIADGFGAIPEAQLFIGPAAAQMAWDDIGSGIPPISNRAQAIAAINLIIEQGEGTPADNANAHFRRFEAIRFAHFDAGRFSARGQCQSIPPTREFRDATGACDADQEHGLTLCGGDLQRRVRHDALAAFPGFRHGAGHRRGAEAAPSAAGRSGPDHDRRGAAIGRNNLGNAVRPSRRSGPRRTLL
ncbi:MAG: hypothetical protein HC869_27480, partial [Rhodospirillales bacterium]|nr:hypothetical protein [Rhodospirillales bacterium]